MIQMFNILLHPVAAKFLEKIDVETCRQIKKKIKELKHESKRKGKHLRYTPFWSLRIGNYRAIYEVQNNEKKIVVLFIGHRDDVYDDFSKLY